MNLKKKIYLSAVMLTLLVAAAISTVILIRVGSLRGFVLETDRQFGETVSDISEDTIEKQIQERMLQVTDGNAKLADQSFAKLESNVQLVAELVTQLYNHEEAYGMRQVARPDADNEGKLAVQLLYSEKIGDPESNDFLNEVGLLGNAQDTLKYINQSMEEMASNYIATESGIMIQADYISASKFDEAGQIAYYEADTRPWYVGAKAVQKPFFTSITRDAHGRGDGIMCGVPFYRGEEFMGVAGAGMYLTNIRDMVMSTKIGESGEACILDKNGQVVYSSMTSGLLVADAEETRDIRQLTNGELQSLWEQAAAGKSGIGKATMDDVVYYIAYAPMETVGWSFITLIREEEVSKPTHDMLQAITQLTDEAMTKTNRHIQNMVYMILGITLMLCIVVWIVSYRMADRIVHPITVLQRKVEAVDGDHLDFSWEMDSHDETQILAEAFGKMTREMKSYIKHITEITAEKEKIGAELSVATKIQEDMLPKVFPAFPDRPEFDVYATMDPAKEVGGDFYDFFQIDEDHMGFVIADVSSKGVPAALFMVISKTLIKNYASHDLDLSRVFESVNNQLCEGNDEGMFVTAWMAVLTISTGELEYVNAGHNAMLWKHGADTYDWIQIDPGFVLAGLPGIPYQSRRTVLQPGDRIFLYTDGVSEAQNEAQELYGEDRLLESVNRNGSLKLPEMLKAIRADVDAFVDGADQFDDITMLAFEYHDRSEDWKESDMMEIKAPATVECLEKVQESVEQYLLKHGCDQATLMTIQVAVEELYVNVANYAYGGETGDMIMQLYMQEGNMFTMVFKDWGVPYNPLEKEDPDTTLSAEDRQIGGLGIYIVKQTMDKVEYVYEDKCNILTIQKEIG